MIIDNVERQYWSLTFQKKRRLFSNNPDGGDYPFFLFLEKKIVPTSGNCPRSIGAENAGTIRFK